MEAVFTKLIEQLNSSVFILVVVLITVMWGLYKLGGWKQMFITHDKKIDKLDELAEKFVSLSAKVDLIYQNTNPNTTVRSASPLAVTAIGKEIMTKINADKVFSKYCDILVEEVEKNLPNNAYDIQQISLKVTRNTMLNILNAEELISIKNEAFNRGILIEDVMNLFGVILRDEILKRKQIPLADIDKHTPVN